jgi:hemerythrin superfamily protein
MLAARPESGPFVAAATRSYRETEMPNARSTTSNAKPKELDAIQLLTADHKEVKAMFKEFESLKEKGDADDEKADLVQRICTALTIHATVEEEIFYPAVREAIDDEDLMDEADVEHASAKHLIAQLQEASPRDDHYDAKVTVLGELIDHHVKEEEGEMFPKAKKAIDSVSVGAELVERKAELQAEMGVAEHIAEGPQDVDLSAAQRSGEKAKARTSSSKRAG